MKNNSFPAGSVGAMSPSEVIAVQLPLASDYALAALSAPSFEAAIESFCLARMAWESVSYEIDLELAARPASPSAPAVGSTGTLYSDLNNLGGSRRARVCSLTVERVTPTLLVCRNEHKNAVKVYRATLRAVGSDFLTPSFAEFA